MAREQQLSPLHVGSPTAAGPVAVVTRRAVERLRQGSVWVYRGDIDQVLPAAGASVLEPGALVTVLDQRGVTLGSALFSMASLITLRMVSDAGELTRADYLRTVALRLEAALALREELAPAGAGNNACRLVFSEADRLPGIIADRYNDLVIVQLLTQGASQPDVREVLARVLPAGIPGLKTVLERPDPRIRIVEALDDPPSQPLFSADPEPAYKTVFTLNGLRFAYDVSAGQKTGAFLDQRLNYQAAADRVRDRTSGRVPGRVLDICTYQGGFALHLARVSERVTGVDASRSALEVADANLELNAASIAAKVDWIEADAFELLREFESAGERYGTIVLDPPAFAKSKRAIEGAMRGYKEMNLRALKMLEPGGTLITCSCSQHVSLQDFQSMLASASADAKRRVQILELRGAAPDHPAIAALPETSYLKCLICRVE